MYLGSCLAPTPLPTASAPTTSPAATDMGCAVKPIERMYQINATLSMPRMFTAWYLLL